MKRALGIDHGDARIGVAVSDDLGMLAHPLETIHVKEVADPVARIATLVTSKDVGHIILGLPRNMDGSYGPAAEKVRAFAEKLRAACGCEVKLWDERLTSVAAQRSLHEAGRKVKDSREVIDQVAAQLILQGWLDSQALLG
ncbi:Holliday junction resolvase YqgF [Chthoniobacter flavus Ellin428]|uniref:Putative pre-16S rRNA nuclease n=1 Tax=Chthoniobacter flavus Ellin428 TaxID=497964 RepID=B4D9U2_9BACT|nr:Holliday junction resolvase RuvX [Chthoniobacter flavus]EDY16873.1 Holliday junction resolvase YqgF [Chthoniobacter flavus Ellin428]TCO93305.1 putative Holliday junction resolvase [Chthoniobacter flavus]